MHPQNSTKIFRWIGGIRVRRTTGNVISRLAAGRCAQRSGRGDTNVAKPFSQQQALLTSKRLDCGRTCHLHSCLSSWESLHEYVCRRRPKAVSDCEHNDNEMTRNA